MSEFLALLCVDEAVLQTGCRKAALITCSLSHTPPPTLPRPPTLSTALQLPFEHSSAYARWAPAWTHQRLSCKLKNTKSFM